MDKERGGRRVENMMEEYGFNSPARRELCRQTALETAAEVRKRKEELGGG